MALFQCLKVKHTLFYCSYSYPYYVATPAICTKMNNPSIYIIEYSSLLLTFHAEAF